ncbi:hypothetical protein HMPREF2863_03725 [Micrococcus sp. HMSC067E09]|uniref:hypothetical protein n=1 Tax=Micrococcus sp. HMSC067E09 TaxID=1739367 RepID=UPI0008D3F55B|nr:hypothetical protein [Micrococcus sp. HMSC067E09]OFR86476.1 hypothetical protein HMPREF2863_03725 [Micrococcus sp. HMSC067E09]
MPAVLTARRSAAALTAALALTLAGCQADPAEHGDRSDARPSSTATTDAGKTSEGSSEASEDDGGPGDAADGSETAGASQDSEGAGDSEGSGDSEGAGTPDGETNDQGVPMRAFSAEETPPQFLLYSFDGGLESDRYEYFMDVAEDVDAKFTVYLSGIHLLQPENRTWYQAPGNEPGHVAKDLGGPKEEIAERIRAVNAAYAAGHEIGTHYMGHLCFVEKYGGDKWDTDDWREEHRQFYEILADPAGINGYDDPDFPELEVPAEAIQGHRLPCLDGRWDQLVPVWKEFGHTYDTSRGSQQRGVAWPYQEDGIWEFEMPLFYSPMAASMGAENPYIMTMDYNFWVSSQRLGVGENDTEKLSEIYLDTYRYVYDSVSSSNRAPIVFGNHFNTYGGDAYNPALAETMKEFCPQEGTYCVTYQTMIDWLELQDPDVLEAWREQGYSAVGDDLAEVRG